MLKTNLKKLVAVLAALILVSMPASALATQSTTEQLVLGLMAKKGWIGSEYADVIKGSLLRVAEGFSGYTSAQILSKIDATVDVIAAEHLDYATGQFFRDKKRIAVSPVFFCEEVLAHELTHATSHRREIEWRPGNIYFLASFCYYNDTIIPGQTIHSMAEGITDFIAMRTFDKSKVTSGLFAIGSKKVTLKCLATDDIRIYALRQGLATPFIYAVGEKDISRLYAASASEYAALEKKFNDAYGEDRLETLVTMGDRLAKSTENRKNLSASASKKLYADYLDYLDTLIKHLETRKKACATSSSIKAYNNDVKGFVRFFPTFSDKSVNTAYKAKLNSLPIKTK